MAAWQRNRADAHQSEKLVFSLCFSPLTVCFSCSPSNVASCQTFHLTGCSVIFSLFLVLSNFIFYVLGLFPLCFPYSLAFPTLFPLSHFIFSLLGLFPLSFLCPFYCPTLFPLPLFLSHFATFLSLALSLFVPTAPGLVPLCFSLVPGLVPLCFSPVPIHVPLGFPFPLACPILFPLSLVLLERQQAVWYSNTTKIVPGGLLHKFPCC